MGRNIHGRHPRLLPRQESSSKTGQNNTTEVGRSPTVIKSRKVLFRQRRNRLPWINHFPERNSNGPWKS